MLTELSQSQGTTVAAGVHRGRVAGRGDGGALVVRALDDGPAALCELLDVGAGSPNVQVGDDVIYLLPPETPGRGCIIGVVRPRPHGSPPQTGVTSLRGDRITIEAGEELVLKTRRASLVLRSNGDIEVLGARLVARARALIKLLAPMLRLN